MTTPAAPTLDILAIGNAIVDVLARSDDDFIAARGMVKGSMQLIDGDQAEALYADMGPAVEVSGGSAANTLAGMAALGRRCGFIGQVADDQLGHVFTHDLRALGVDYRTAPLAGGAPTARCLILISPDGQRTMNTYLGASHLLDRDMIDEEQIASAAILYLEGYLWDPELSRAAMRRAIDIARGAGRKVAFTLSDAFIIDRHGADFRALIDDGRFDILFANESEIAALAGLDDFEAAVAAIAPKLPTLVVTRGDKGAIAVAGGSRYAVDAEPIDHVVDTTGAGDLFAAGFLSGMAEGRGTEDCLTMGAVCARAIIAQVGPRAQADLAALVTQKLG
ncbi:MAG: hypothetical protein RLZZ58_735 [Pseudomonadota bacterium]